MTSWLAAKVEPLDALHRHFNVAKVGYRTGQLEERFAMTLTTLSGSLYPTHYLAATQSNAPTNSLVLILPVDAHFYRRGFNPDLTWPNNDETVERPVESESTEDVPVTIPPLSNEPLRMSLPLCPISVPHLISLPLLLLFGLGLERDVEQLPYRLLPASVVAEFPAPAAMAEIFAKFPEEQFERYYMHIKGFWGNILALGLKNERIVQIASTAWNVATEARRIRQRQPVTPAQRR